MWPRAVSLSRFAQPLRVSLRTRNVSAPILPQARSSHATTSDKEQSEKTTHFGFRTVSTDDKESLGEGDSPSPNHNHYLCNSLVRVIVKNVFSSVASSYDFMNDAMSIGVHRLWKDDFVRMLDPGSSGPIKCLDVAGGTGDISLRILDYAREVYADRETEITVSDINPDMLEVGKRRFKQSMYWKSQSLRPFPPHAHTNGSKYVSSPGEISGG
jgi:2-methoxy-6-polyprenyl-1,4-benzoquinol methylase